VVKSVVFGFTNSVVYSFQMERGYITIIGKEFSLQISCCF